MAEQRENVNLNAAVRPVLVPAYIENFNATARAHGLVVSVPRIVREEVLTGYGRSTTKDDEHLVVEWRGTAAQLRSLGWILPSWSFPVATARGPGCKRLETKWGVDGYVHVPASEDEVIFEIDHGDAPISLSATDGVETICLDWCVEYHGTAGSLQDAGIADKQRLSGKKPTKTNGNYPDEPRWWRLIQPDGSIVFGIESDLAWRRRKKEAERVLESARESQLVHQQNREPSSRFNSAEEWKERLESRLETIETAYSVATRHMRDTANQFQLDPESTARLGEIFRRARNEIAQLMASARIVSAQRSKLHLIVDNSSDIRFR